jgi:hypothetical protein
MAQWLDERVTRRQAILDLRACEQGFRPFPATAEMSHVQSR